ncbi:MAG: hypothetical protein HDR26_03035 [Lachnospiraceae bacterium]|nr:hypothetical protein [Lachnospiraceae bacterium]
MQRIKIYAGRAAAAVSWLYIIAAAGIMPFYFTEGYGYIGSDKAAFFRSVGFPLAFAALAAACFYCIVTYMGNRKAFGATLKSRISATDICMLCYLVSLIISYLLSEYQEHALLGSDTWPMGLLTHLALIASYFALSRSFLGEKWLYALLLGVTTVVFALGLLNRYGIYPIQMDYAGPAFISTIGNVNWYCGYWSVLVCFSLLAYWNRTPGKTAKEMRLTAGFALLSLIGLAAGITQGSDSGILALAAVYFALFCFSVDNPDKMQRFTELLFLFCLACLACLTVNKLFPDAVTFLSVPMQLLTNTIFPCVATPVSLAICLIVRQQNSDGTCNTSAWEKIRTMVSAAAAAGLALYLLTALLNTTLPQGVSGLYGNSLFTFSREWASSRGGTWSAGIKIWESQDLLHKIFGTGPDCMSEYLYSGRNTELLTAVREQFGNDRLLNAHGEWITVLANLGVFGLLSYACLIISFLRRTLKKGAENPMLYVLGFCVLCYTVNNIFSFQTMANVTQLFLLMGVGESLLRREQSLRQTCLSAMINT